MRQSEQHNRLYPWIIWLMGSLFFFYKYCVQVSPSVMTDDLMAAFHINGAGLGNLSAFYFYAYLTMQVPVGVILDRYSPRLVTTLAIILCASSTLLFASIESLFAASISRALMGAGAAFAAVSCFKMAAIWFPPKRFAMISGLCMTAAMLGGVGGQMPLSMLVHAVGWRESLLIIGYGGFGLAIAYFLIVRNKQVNSPTLSKTTHSEVSVMTHLRQIFRNPQSWLLSIYSGLAFMPVSVFGGLWGVPFLMTCHGLTRNLASFSVSCIFIGFAIGAPIWGFLSDHIKKRNPILIAAPFIGLITLSTVIFVHHLSIFQIQLLLTLFGFGASAFFTCFAMIKELFPFYLVATVLGIMNAFDSLCEAIFEPLVGSVLDYTWNGAVVAGIHKFSPEGYRLALSLLPVCLLLALLLLTKVRETHCLSYEEREI